MREDLRAGDPPSHMEEHHQDLLQPLHQAAYFIPKEDEEGPQSRAPVITRGRASPRPPATTPQGILFHPRGRMRKDHRARHPPSERRRITRTSWNNSTGHLTSSPGRMRKDHRARYPSSHVEGHHQDLLQPLHRASYFILEGG